MEAGKIFAHLLCGCAGDGSWCEQLAAPARHYEAGTGEAGAGIALQGEVALRADFPAVAARCVLVSPDPGMTVNSGDPAPNRLFATIRRATVAMSAGAAQPRPR
jgi:hypothetical protein